MRNLEFKEETKFKPLTIKDSRFGIRKIFINKYESPSIGTYVNPGRGPNGESSN